MGTRMQMPVEARRRFEIPWTWSFRQLWATQCGASELNPGCLQKQCLAFSSGHHQLVSILLLLFCLSNSAPPSLLQTSYPDSLRLLPTSWCFCFAVLPFFTLVVSFQKLYISDCVFFSPFSFCEVSAVPRPCLVWVVRIEKSCWNLRETVFLGTLESGFFSVYLLGVTRSRFFWSLASLASKRFKNQNNKS